MVLKQSIFKPGYDLRHATRKFLCEARGTMVYGPITGIACLSAYRDWNERRENGGESSDNKKEIEADGMKNTKVSSIE